MKPLEPGDTLGILGGGQLGRMIAVEAARLGLICHVYAPDADSPAFEVAARHTVAAYDDGAAMAAFAGAVDVMTPEFENVPVAPLRPHAHKLRPCVEALEVAQDRLAEKAFLSSCGLAVAEHAAVSSADDLAAAVPRLAPGVLKTRRFGYDGKGQLRINKETDAQEAFAALGGVPAILEALVPFQAETSTVIARGADGAVAAYDLPENSHGEGILRRSVLPGPASAELATEAQRQTAAVAQRLGYVGVLAIEWFLTGDPANPLVANEMAPRVHNTGHWTQDGAFASQFENHVRAVAGWPLGAAHRTHDVEMVNLIGDEAQDWHRHLETADAKLHLYGKRSARPGRKMGHVNFLRRPVDFRSGAC